MNYKRKSILMQQCVVTISPVPYVFFVGIIWRKWKLYIFGKLRVLWIWKPMLAFFQAPVGRHLGFSKWTLFFLKMTISWLYPSYIHGFGVKYTFMRSMNWTEWLRIWQNVNIIQKLTNPTSQWTIWPYHLFFCFSFMNLKKKCYTVYAQFCSLTINK